MKRDLSTKQVELIILSVLACASMLTLVVLAKSGEVESEVKIALIVQMATVLTMIIQAIRNVPQGEAMNRMVEHLAKSQPPKRGDEE